MPESVSCLYIAKERVATFFSFFCFADTPAIDENGHSLAFFSQHPMKSRPSRPSRLPDSGLGARQATMSGKEAPGRGPGPYGSLAHDLDYEDNGEEELAWYDQPVRRQNPRFLAVTFAFFASLAVLGVALNAAGVVRFGPGFTKEPPLHGLSICEVDFCGGGVLISEDGVIIDTSERAGWMNPLSPDKLASCSADRDTEGASFEALMIVQFANPTDTSVELWDFHMTFATDGDAVVAECAAVTAPAKINPLGGNRLDVSCKFFTPQVAQLVASWWNGDTTRLKHWWTGTASVAADANLKALSFSHGDVGDDLVKFTLPPRPYGGPDVWVTVDDGVSVAAVGAAKNKNFRSLGKNVQARVGKSFAATMGDDTAAVMIADDDVDAKDANADADAKDVTVFGLPSGTKLGDLFNGDGVDVLLPNQGSGDDNIPGPNNAKCPGALDLQIAAPSVLVCDAEVDKTWAASFAKCALGDETSGGELFSTWNSEACRGLMKGVPLSVRLVVDNPSDLFITLTRVKPKVWLTGRETSVADGAIISETLCDARASVAVDAFVTVPWESEETFVVDAKKWWAGEGLDIKMDASFGARALGIGVRVAVPEMAYTVWTPDKTEHRDTVETTKTRARNGECVCFAGACQFGAYVPGSGKRPGEACVLATQCASKVCGWDFLCE